MKIIKMEKGTLSPLVLLKKEKRMKKYLNNLEYEILIVLFLALKKEDVYV